MLSWLRVPIPPWVLGSSPSKPSSMLYARPCAGVLPSALPAQSKPSPNFPPASSASTINLPFSLPEAAMRFIRYQPPSGAPGFGWVLEERVGPLEGSPFAEFRRGEALHTLDEVRLLAPIHPSKIFSLGRTD